MRKHENLDHLFDGAREIISRADAKARGLKRYFTGNPCKRGHVAERRVSGQICIDCAKVASAKHYGENSDKVKKSQAKYYAENADKVKARAAYYRAEHLDEAKAYRARYYAETADKAKASNARWCAENVDKSEAYKARWLAENPGYSRAACLLRRARKRGVISTQDANLINGEIRVYGGWCYYCGETLLHGEAHADHVVPLAQGGPHAAINLVCSCVKCNLRKSDKTPSQWRDLPTENAERAIAREEQVHEWVWAHILG